MRARAWDIAAKLVATILCNFEILARRCANVLHLLAIIAGALHLPKWRGPEDILQ